MEQKNLFSKNYDMYDNYYKHNINLNAYKLNLCILPYLDSIQIYLWFI